MLNDRRQHEKTPRGLAARLVYRGAPASREILWDLAQTMYPLRGRLDPRLAVEATWTRIACADEKRRRTWRRRGASQARQRALSLSPSAVGMDFNTGCTDQPPSPSAATLSQISVRCPELATKSTVARSGRRAIRRTRQKPCTGAPGRIQIWRARQADKRDCLRVTRQISSRHQAMPGVSTATPARQRHLARRELRLWPGFSHSSKAPALAL